MCRVSEVSGKASGRSLGSDGSQERIPGTLLLFLPLSISRFPSLPTLFTQRSSKFSRSRSGSCYATRPSANFNLVTKVLPSFFLFLRPGVIGLEASIEHSPVSASLFILLHFQWSHSIWFWHSFGRTVDEFFWHVRHTLCVPVHPQSKKYLYFVFFQFHAVFVRLRHHKYSPMCWHL